MTSVLMQMHAEAMERRQRLFHPPMAVQEPKEPEVVVKPVMTFEEALARQQAITLEARRRAKLARWNAARQRQVQFEHDLAHAGGRYRITYSRVERLICRVLRVTGEELKSGGRGREIVFARQAVMYWAIRLTRLSYPEIGRRLDRDHSSVVHGVASYPKKRAKQGRTLRKAR